LTRALNLALLALACSAPPDGRWMFLEREEVHGNARVCWYSDGLGERAETVPVWEACEPYVEVEE
jgi:hypothetical protein